jgi:glycosyltransferase involved in cell wall biosynthesis
MKNVVSVIIPCFNNASTIEETIASVQNQTFKSFEIIVVDDGSTDGSIDVVNQIIAQDADKKISVYQQQNSGPSKARNLGASYAKGKYLMFLDADDLIHTDYLQLTVDLLEKEDALNVVYSKAAFFDARKGEWKLKPFSRKKILMENMIFISAVVRKSVFDGVGGFDERINYCEDWDLWIGIVFTYGGVYRIDKTLFYYRKRQDSSSLSDKMNFKIHDSIEFIYKKHYAHYLQEGYGVHQIFDLANRYESLYKKYYNVWYRRLFYLFKKRK